MSDENITAPNTSDYTLNPHLICLGTKTTLEVKGSCLKQEKITYDHGKVVNVYIVCETTKNFNNNNYSTIENYLFGAVNLTKNIDIDQHNYSGYRIRFNRRFRNVIIFGVGMSSFTKIDNSKKYILILGKGPSQ